MTEIELLQHELGISDKRIKDLEDLAFYMPVDKYILRWENEWDCGTHYTRNAIKMHLLGRGWPNEAVKKLLGGKYIRVVRRVELIPNKPEMIEETPGEWVINTWVKPELSPTPNPFPHIELALNWLTADRDAKPDPEGRRWLEHWMAAKVQHPERVHKVAVVFATGQGAGKGHLAGVMRHILGIKNTAQIDHNSLITRFNSWWAEKLFVLADEVMTSDSMKDISSHLKILIDSKDITSEGKGTNQKSVASKLSWWFASNDRSTPVALDTDDRRYTVFANYTRPSLEYKAKLKSCYDPKTTTDPTPAFLKEIAGFWDYLLELKVDFEWIREPYRNAARESLIGSNQHSVDYFATQINRHGLDEHRAPVLQANGKWEGRTWDFSGLPEWEGKEEVPVASGALYACYKDFTLKTGKMKVSQQRFETHLRNSKVWDEVKVKDGNREVDCWLVPKKPTVRMP